MLRHSVIAAVARALAIAAAAGLPGCGRTLGGLCAAVTCGAGETCDPATGLCASDGDGGTPDGGGDGGCSRDSHCPSGRCLVAESRCVQCLASADCPEQTCDTATHACKPIHCFDDQDCNPAPATPRCASDGVCVQCLVRADCPAQGGVRRVCDVDARACVAQPCTAHADCAGDPAGPKCSPGGTCVECVGDSDCAGVAGAPNCDPQTFACVGCVDDGDCDSGAGEGCDAASHTCRFEGCVNDAQCAGPDHCQTGLRECAPCGQDADCVLGGACIAGAVHASCAAPGSCLNDGDCPWPMFCSAAGACIECSLAFPCAAGRPCTAGTCGEPARCTQAEQCASGRVCKQGACAAAECVDDAFEPNDLAGEAAGVETGRTSALRSCPNDDDWYAVDVPAGHGVQATALYSPAEGTLDLQVVRAGPAGPEVLATSRATVLGAQAVVEKLPAGTLGPVFVGVHAGETDLGYALEVKTSAVGYCLDDDAEDDDAQSQAASAAEGTHAAVSCSGDEDWMRVDAPAGKRAVAHLALTDLGAVSGVAVGDLSIQWFILFNGQIFPVSNGFGYTDASTSAFSTPQTYFLVVRNRVGEKRRYSLALEFKPPVPPHDACASARVLGNGTVDSATTAGGADDIRTACGQAGGLDVFHRFTLADSRKVELGFTGSFDGVLGLYSGTCDGLQAVTCTDAAGTSETLKATLPAGTYTVVVDGFDATRSGTYTLRLTTTQAPAPPGGTCAAPVTLAFADGLAEVTGDLALSPDALAGCGRTGGDAVYRVHLDAPKRVRLSLAADFPQASLVLGACGASPFCEPTGTQASGTAVIDKLALPAGDHLVAVDGGRATGGGFTLRAELLDPIFPPANDACDAPETLVDGVAATGDTAPATDDTDASCAAAGGAADTVYAFTLSEDKGVRLELTPAVGFDAVLSLRRADCSDATPGTGEVACSDAVPPKLVFPALAAGTYHAIVDGYAAREAGTYTLKMTLSDPAQTPPNDLCDVGAAPVAAGAQFGTTAAAADDLHPSGCTGGPLDGGDVFYPIVVGAGQTLTARVEPQGWDAALYVLTSCSLCRAGADQSFVAGGAETTTFKNNGTAAVTAQVAVDSFNPGAYGPFTLTLSLSP